MKKFKTQKDIKARRLGIDKTRIISYERGLVDKENNKATFVLKLDFPYCGLTMSTDVEKCMSIEEAFINMFDLEPPSDDVFRFEDKECYIVIPKQSKAYLGFGVEDKFFLFENDFI